MSVVFLHTHPVQYQAPVFREMARQGYNFQVLYGLRMSPNDLAESGFGVRFEWDIDLLDGYRHRFIDNTAKQPTLHAFRGIDFSGAGSVLEELRPRAVVIHGWHFLAAWQTALACWRRRIPYIIRGDSQFADRRPLWLRLAKFPAIRFLIGNAAGCLCAGSRSRDYFAHYGCAANRIRMAPHGVDCARFTPVARGPGGPSVFLFCGKLVAFKRPLDFLRALAITVRSGERVEGIIAGDGPLRRACEEMIERECLPVRLLGFVNQSQLPTVYQTANFLVLPSTDAETWGVVVNEAMSSGVPAIASDAVGSAPDLIQATGSGFTYPSGDVGALAAKIRAAASMHPTEYAAATATARKVALTASNESAATALRQAIEQILAVVPACP